MERNGFIPVRAHTCTRAHTHIHPCCAQGYVDAMADLIVQELVKFPEPTSVEIFFSAHGVPKSYVEEAGVCRVVVGAGRCYCRLGAAGALHACACVFL